VGATCVRCTRPTADGYACTGCTDRARGHLAEIADMTGAARDVARRLSATQSGGGGSGKPGSSLPLDLGATARLDAVQAELVGWVRHIAEERGGGVLWSVRGLGDRDDLLVAASEWLQGHLEWLRHRQEVSEALSGIEACARVVRGLARGPREQKYLGPCGAEICASTHQGRTCTLAHDASQGLTWHTARDGESWSAWVEPPTRTCEGDVYGPAGGNKGSCRTCGAQVDQAERRAWLDDQVRDKAFRAAHIADAYGINVKTIRSWADRGHLLEHGKDRDERPLYLVGDVLDLAALAAARRAENEARKAREDMAA
jgi:hypothetical protein